jgi:hypothetical protein
LLLKKGQISIKFLSPYIEEIEGLKALCSYCKARYPGKKGMGRGVG